MADDERVTNDDDEFVFEIVIHSKSLMIPISFELTG